MSVKGYFDFDVVVTAHSDGKAVSEVRKVRFDMFDLIRSGLDPQGKAQIAKEGALGLVKAAHPIWKDLVVKSCIEV